MQRFVCTNCGFWQTHFEAPRSCPVCLDFRHTPPDEKWEFLSVDEAAARFQTTWREDDGVWIFETSPKLGIGPSGYLIPRLGDALVRRQAAPGSPSARQVANIFFESCGFYSKDALDFIASKGGIAHLSASHPHAYGANWQLQERFSPEVAIQVRDLNWTNAFAVSRPFDEQLHLTNGVELVHTGGHFDGHSVLVLRDIQTLFAGDMLKFHFVDETFEGISTHKAFNRRIPMSHAEIRRYREVVEGLGWKRIYTTFERGPDNCRDLALRLFDEQLAGKPFFGPIKV